MMLAMKQNSSTNIAKSSARVPTRILEIELGQPLPSVFTFDNKMGQHYQHALCLVRLHSQPLGRVELELDESGMNAYTLAEYIWHALQVQINEHLRQDDLPEVGELTETGLPSSSTPRCLEEREHFLAHAPFVSIIVPTHNRPDRIERCLRSLLSLHYNNYEIIVADNAPSTTATGDMIQQTYSKIARVRYLREDHPGAPWARNAGIMAARGEILAFVDDDVVVDPHWLTGLARAFNLADDVMCVTGLILPWELETPAQDWFEQYGGFSKGFTQRVFDMAKNRPTNPLYPYTAGSFGSGANMAFRTKYLRGGGGFDTKLGRAEDFGAFFQVIMQGYKLVYEPAAIVHHPHHRDYQDLRKQIYRYGVGLTAFFTKTVLDQPKLFFDLATKIPYGLFFLLSKRSPKNKNKRKDYPRDLTLSELKGMIYGPFIYLWSRLHCVRQRRLRLVKDT